MSTEVTTTKNAFRMYLSTDAIKNSINSTIGADNGQRFVSQIISAVSTNPDLQACDHGTILSAALVGEALKLSPSPQLGQFYIVPFKDNKRGRTVATPVIGYKGYVQLAIRSGQYKRLNVLAIKEGELLRYDPLTEDIDVALIENDSEREGKPTIGYFAMFEYLNGFRKTMYWSRKKMEEHASRYSAAYKSDKKYKSSKSFWTSDFDSQALKTMIRQLLSKWGMMSTEIQRAFESDTFHTESGGEFVSNDEPVKSTASAKLDEALGLDKPKETEVIDVEPENTDDDDDRPDWAKEAK